MVGSPKLTTDNEWSRNLVEDEAGIDAILDHMRRIAILGIKTPEAGGPAYHVPAWLQEKGYDIVPVPIYFPNVTEILGQHVVRTLSEISPPADLIQVFRRPEDIPGHLDDILTAHPAVVWMQLGIRHPDVAEVLARHGIKVVQDRCLQVELRRQSRARRG